MYVNVQKRKKNEKNNKSIATERWSNVRQMVEFH